MLPSLSLPARLVTRIATCETFGQDPISGSLFVELGMRKGDTLDRAIGPRLLVTRFETKCRSDRQFIRGLQGTVKDVTPVALPAEYQVFMS